MQLTRRLMIGRMRSLLHDENSLLFEAEPSTAEKNITNRLSKEGSDFYTWQSGVVYLMGRTRWCPGRADSRSYVRFRVEVPASALHNQSVHDLKGALLTELEDVLTMVEPSSQPRVEVP